MRLKAIIFDWAGTVVDFGSLCPVSAFQAAFLEKGIAVTPEEIQQFMGIHKREHILAILALPPVRLQWQAVHGREPTPADVNGLYRIAESRILATVAGSATPTRGLDEALAFARQTGLRIGSTTGYTAPLMERLAPAAAQQGYAPEFWVASDQVPHGRPWPWMIFKNMEHLKIYPPSAIVKVGDTVADVAEANNAGVWAVAVAESSSLVGKSESDLAALSTRERQRLIRMAARKLALAGAHFVIENLSELAATLEQIEYRLERAQMPPQLLAGQ
jgi:phosphonoacetaldehyde hydrolase